MPKKSSRKSPRKKSPARSPKRACNKSPALDGTCKPGEVLYKSSPRTKCCREKNKFAMLLSEIGLPRDEFSNVWKHMTEFEKQSAGMEIDPAMNGDNFLRTFKRLAEAREKLARIVKVTNLSK